MRDNSRRTALISSSVRRVNSRTYHISLGLLKNNSISLTRTLDSMKSERCAIRFEGKMSSVSPFYKTNSKVQAEIRSVLFDGLMHLVFWQSNLATRVPDPGIVCQISRVLLAHCPKRLRDST